MFEMADSRNATGNINNDIRDSWYSRKQGSSQPLVGYVKRIQDTTGRALMAKDTSWGSMVLKSIK